MCRIAKSNDNQEFELLKSKVRVAFVAGGSQLDRRAWSGTVYYAHRALAERFDVVPIEMPLVTKIFARFRQVMRKTGIDPLWEPLAGRLLAGLAARRIKAEQVDAVFVLGASHMAAGLIDRFALFHCSDTTFANMVDYHKNFSELSPRTVRLGNLLEQKIFAGCWAAFLSSDWAARSARADYGADSRVHVVPFGANLDALPAADVWRRGDACVLVFIGVAWYEKGADVAVEAVRLLNERGVPTLLHMVGCMPPPGVETPPYVKLHGFLRKQVPAEYARLTDLVADADFLIVPTRFEAYGIVFCEAAAHGTPAVARRTGGIPTIVEDDVTGILLSPQDEPVAYADRIQAVWSDPPRYQAMRRAAFAKSRRILNWTAWGDTVEAVMTAALAGTAAPPAGGGPDGVGATSGDDRASAVR